MSSDLVICLKIEDAVKLKDDVKDSETFFAKGLLWKLRARTENSPRTENEDAFSVYLFCNWESENADWSCDWSTEFILQNKDSAKHFTQSLDYQCKLDDSHRGFFNIMKWNELIDVNEGFIVNGAVVVEARISVNKIAGMRIPKPLNFSMPIDNISNVILLVENKRLHVSKQILSMCSPVFYSTFFGGFTENGKEEVEIKEVDYDQFVDFLNVLHPTTFTEILKRTVPHLLELADRFQVETVLDKAENYLLSTKKFETPEKLAFADRFRLKILLMRCLNSYSSAEELSKLGNTKQFKEFSNDAKAAICERLMELANKKTAPQ